MKQKLNFRFLMAFVIGILSSISMLAQDITVKGKVVDDMGEVIGATVLQKGTTNGCTTDFDGNFTLKAPKGSTLVISFVGYITQEVQVTGAPINIHLKDDSQMLSEAIVIGYGTVKKNDMTGSVTAIKPDDMNHGLQTTATDMIQGKIAGVNVISTSGEPGASASIRIRGGSSLNASNNPLIVIDGLAMDGYGGVEGSPNALALVNPADIESFTVLKDASATAIYGSRASNGVIIITTKKGRKGTAPKISYNGNVSVSANTRYMDVLNGSEYTDLVKSKVLANNPGWSEQDWQNSVYYKNLGYWETDENGNKVQKFANTDWQKEIYRVAVSTDHNITVSGGLKNMPYRVSLGYTNQTGTLKTSDYNRFTGSVNLNPTFFKEHLTVNFNAKYMHSRASYANTGAIGESLSMDPTKPIYDKSADAREYGGYWQWPLIDPTFSTTWGESNWTHGRNTFATGNPVASIYNQKNIGKTNDLMGNIELDYKIHGFEDLHLHVNGGMDRAWGHSDKTTSPYAYSNLYWGSNGWNETKQYNLSLNAYAQYIKDFNEKNHFDIMAGYEWQHFHKQTDYDYPVYYPASNPKAGELKDPDYYKNKNSLYKTENYLVSWFGRLNYSLLDRYLITATLRADGSSRFAKGHRWGIFPSVAAAWKIKEEAFLRESDAVSDLKLRLGWGKTGQQEGIGDYSYFTNYTVNSAGAFYPTVGNGATYRPEAYNPELTWEKTTTWNAGLDMGFAKDRLVANVDFYYRKTTDLINTAFVAVGSNFSSSVTKNIGSLHNLGVEAMLTWRAIQTKNWRWELTYNVGWNKNRIDELISTQGDDYMVPNAYCSGGTTTSDNMIKAYKKGEAVSAFYVFQQVYDENGQPIFGEVVDRDGNGVIDNNDKYFYKKSDADVTMGFTSKLIFKKWDLGFSLRASLNNYVYNSVEAGDNGNLSMSRLYSGDSYHNVLRYELPKNWQSSSAIASSTDYFVQNASFLRCDNITLGYSFDHIGKSKISGRAYMTAQNVFTITKYKGLDPELSANSNGCDGSIYPRPFTGILGVSLNF